MWKIVLDFDSTIADSADCILNKLFNISDWKPETLEWDFAPYGSEAERKLMVASFMKPEFWDNLTPINGVVNWIKQQYEEKIPVYICSKRTNNDFEHVISWCQKYGIDQYITDYVFICKSYDKSIIMDEETIIIDDKPDCFYKSDIGYPILFGNYKYAASFLEGKDQKNIVKIPDWKAMPHWRLTEDDSIVRV